MGEREKESACVCVFGGGGWGSANKTGCQEYKTRLLKSTTKSGWDFGDEQG